jgi:hypothetical protein
MDDDYTEILDWIINVKQLPSGYSEVVDSNFWDLVE